MKITYVDSEGMDLEIGDKVCADDGDDRVAGTIVKIEEPDIDDSADDGIPQRSGPYIYVEWAGRGGADRFVGTLHSHGGNPYDDYENYEEEYIFDELQKVG